MKGGVIGNKLPPNKTLNKLNKIKHKYTPAYLLLLCNSIVVKKVYKGIYPINYMVRKKPEEWSTISLEKSTIKKLKDYKIHPNQSLNEIIKKHLDKDKGEEK